MSLDALIMLLGTFVALLPFLGFPNSWDQILLLSAGIFIVILGIIVRRRNNKVEELNSMPMQENRPQDFPRHDLPPQG